MFIKTAGFKRMIKDAYSGGGLKVINNGDTYTIAGSCWIIEIYCDRLPKKEKAAIIELTGELPERDEGFEATKAGNQYEITENVLYQVMKDAREMEKPLIQTQLFLKTGAGRIARVLQNPADGKITLINQMITQSISNDAVDAENGETAWEGPLLGPVGDVIWRNNWMAFRVFGIVAVEESDTAINLAKLGEVDWK